MKVHFPEYAKEIDEAREDSETNYQSTDKYNRDELSLRSDLPPQDGQPMVRKFVRWSKVNVPKVMITDNLTGMYKVVDKDDYKKAYSGK